MTHPSLIDQCIILLFLGQNSGKEITPLTNYKEIACSFSDKELNLVMKCELEFPYADKLIIRALYFSGANILSILASGNSKLLQCQEIRS